MNIIAELKKNISPELVKIVANQISEDPQKTKIALESLMSVLLGSFMKRSSTEMGATSILNIINQEKYDGSLTKSLLENAKQDDIVKIGQRGSTLFSLLTPDKKSIIISTVSSFSKIRNSSAVTLLGIGTPLVLDGIGKTINNSEKTATALISLLADQKEHLISETKPELLEKTIEILGIKEFLENSNIQPTNSSKKPSIKISDYEDDTSGNGFGGIPIKNILIGVISLLALIGVSYWYFSKPTESPIIEPTEEAVEMPIDSLKNTIDTLASGSAVLEDSSQGTQIIAKPIETAPAPKAPVINLGLTAGGTADQLASYLADTSAVKGKMFSYGNLEFDLASTNLSQSSDAKINELVKVLIKFPNAQIKISGYVGKTADSLKARSLSFKRANAIKLVLASKGINMVRLDAEGRGRSTGIPRIDFKVVKR